MSDLADVSDRRVLITGGTSGLGRAMARSLAEGGAQVVITGRDGARAADVAHALEVQLGVGEGSGGRPDPDGVGGRVTGIAMDVRDEASVTRGIAAAYRVLSQIDALVNNAGIGMRTVNARFLEESTAFHVVAPEAFRDLFDTNVLGYFLVARAVVPRMVEAGRGTVVNISINEETMRRRGFAPYGPSRAATDALSRVMAADLAGTGVDVHLLLPGGATDTGMIPDGLPAAARNGLLDPSVMGPAIRWLCSRESDGRTDLRVVARAFSPPAT